jgi:hypothetical protein
MLSEAKARARQHKTSADHEELVDAFLSVRQALGLLGFILPVALLIAAGASGDMRSSISGFYHTFMGDVIVGVLVAIGVFLIAYVGHRKKPGEKGPSDRLISTVAGFGAIGVALFPTMPPDVDCGAFEPPIIVQGFVFHWCGLQWLHFVSAGVFFASTAYICLRTFTKKADGKVRYETKGDGWYVACGLVIVLAIIGLLVIWQAEPPWAQEISIVFWLETVCVIAFALAWLIKGNALGGVPMLTGPKAASAETAPGFSTRAPT